MKPEDEEYRPTTFVEFFGEYPNIKVLDFLLESRGDFSKTEIANFSNIGWSTLEELWSRLEKHGIVKIKRKIGRAVMYELNRDNPIIKALDEFDKILAVEGMDLVVKRDNKIDDIRDITRMRFPGRLEGEIKGWKVRGDDILRFRIKFPKEKIEELAEDKFLTKIYKGGKMNILEVLEDGTVIRDYRLKDLDVREGIVFVDSF